MPPADSIRRAGVVCASFAACSSALYSMVFLSGLNSSWLTMPCIEAGKVPAFSSSAYWPWMMACCFFFSMPASAAFRVCSGAFL